jgi:hypothetical protein
VKSTHEAERVERLFGSLTKNMKDETRAADAERPDLDPCADQWISRELDSLRETAYDEAAQLAQRGYEIYYDFAVRKLARENGRAKVTAAEEPKTAFDGVISAVEKSLARGRSLIREALPAAMVEKSLAVTEDLNAGRRAAWTTAGAVMFSP